MKPAATCLLLVILAFLHAFNAKSQVTINMVHYAELFEQHKYIQAFNEAYSLRKYAVYGKTPLLSYIMAKALCGTGQYDDANRAFEYILTEYSLNKAQKAFLVEEMNTCGASNIGNDISFNQTVMAKYFVSSSDKQGQVAFVSGKLGNVVDCSPDPDAYRIDSTFITGNFSQRLFDKDKARSAEYYYSQLLGPSYDCFLAGDILIVTGIGNKVVKDEALKAGQELDRVLNFYHTYFHLRLPDKLITVFFARDKKDLGFLAAKLHGLTLSKANIAYSSLPDLTIVGISDMNKMGTIKHELFHLAVRTEIGDIPAWLDEGVACLYETSHWEGDALVGEVDNWRTDVLSGFIDDGRRMPSIDEILKQNWDGFLLSERNTPCDVAFRYALVKHLAIFLQQQHLLAETMDAFRKRPNVMIDTLMPNMTQDMLLSDATGKSLEGLQTVFYDWLGTIGHFTHQSVLQINQHNMEVVHANMDILRKRNEESAKKFDRECQTLIIELHECYLDVPPELLDRVRNFLDRYQAELRKYNINY